MGGFAAIEFAGERLRLVVLPEFGARVVSLSDLRTGREWLLNGALAPPTVRDRGAVFDAEVAWGWDECLPTVAPGPDPMRRQATLRDHGDVWGRHLSIEASSGTQVLTTTLRGSAADGWSYLFTRSLTVHDATVLAGYELENSGDRRLPFLWSMHPLLALEPGSRFHLPAVTDVIAGFAAGAPAGDLLTSGRPPRIGWPIPGAAGGGSHRLDLVAGVEARDAAKLYAGPLERGLAAASTPDGSWLGLTWDVGLAPYLGIWSSNGGWPSTDAGVSQHALEPTTAPVDDLSQAIAADTAVWLDPRERRSWWVRLQVGEPDEDLAAFLR